MADETKKEVNEIVIPDDVETIGAYTYRGDLLISDVVFGKSVRFINSGAFFGCRGITALEFPPSLETIGVCAFFGCVNLRAVFVQSAVPPTFDPSTSFMNVSPSFTVYVPKGMLDTYHDSEWNRFTLQEWNE